MPTRRRWSRWPKYYASEREFLVVWGWRSDLYVKTNMLPGTRFGDSPLQLEPTAQAAFFRRQYLQDFVATGPPLFLDAVGPGAFRYDDRGARATRRSRAGTHHPVQVFAGCGRGERPGVRAQRSLEMLSRV